VGQVVKPSLNKSGGQYVDFDCHDFFSEASGHLRCHPLMAIQWPWASDLHHMVVNVHELALQEARCARSGRRRPAPTAPRPARRARSGCGSPYGEKRAATGLLSMAHRGDLARRGRSASRPTSPCTTAPGPDVAPYRDRQVAVLPAADWPGRINLTRPGKDLLQPLPSGTLQVEMVRQGKG
jgi:hypothetical protein